MRHCTKWKTRLENGISISKREEGEKDNSSEAYFEQRENAILCRVHFLISFHFSGSNFDSLWMQHINTQMECANAMNSAFGLTKNFTAIEKLFFLCCIRFFSLNQNGVNCIRSLWIRRCYFLYWHRFLNVCRL